MILNHFWKVALGITVFSLSAAGFAQIATLSEGACWYEFDKETLKLASFNDKSVYQGNKAQMEAEIEILLNHKVTELDFSLHCGGYGASLVAKVATDNGSFCVWTKFEKGKLSPRSIGVIEDKGSEDQLCHGHKSGEFILGVNSQEFLTELQGPKWSGVIKDINRITDKVYKIVLMKDFENREGEVASQLEENFAGKNFIRYIEFNEYHHPVGDYVSLK